MNVSKRRVTLITGAAGNLGRAVAERFATGGDRLVLLDRPESLPDSIAELAGEHLYIGGADVTDPDSAAEVVAKAIDRHGQIDVLINTVGGFKGGSPVHETPVEEWDLMMQLNARSVFVMSNAVIPGMVERNSGKIVSIASGAALEGTAGLAGYSASKAAVVRLTESMAAELRDNGINANCILPTTIDTPQNRSAMPKADTSKWVKPESLAEVVAFLASPAARDLFGVGVKVG